MSANTIPIPGRWSKNFPALRRLLQEAVAQPPLMAVRQLLLWQPVAEVAADEVALQQLVVELAADKLLPLVMVVPLLRAVGAAGPMERLLSRPSEPSIPLRRQWSSEESRKSG